MLFRIRSIRWRLVILFIVVAYSVGIPLRLSNYRFMRERLITDLDNRLERRLNVLAELADRNAPQGLTEAIMEDLMKSPRGREVLGPYPASLLLPHTDHPPATEFAGIWQDGKWIRGWGTNEGLGDPATLDPDQFRVQSRERPDGGLLVSGSSIGETLRELHGLMLIYLITMLGGAFILIPLAIGISTMAMRPLREISRIAQRIARGESRLRLDTAIMATELQDMGGALNQMIDRLEGQALSHAAFTADISHELGNPINSILLQTQIAGDSSATPEEMRTTLQSCGELAERMNRLRKGLLDLARAEATSPTEFPPIDLEPVMEEALDSVRDMAKARRVRLDCRPASLEAKAHADLLHQVLINLLTNAIRHSPAGGTVWLEAAISREDGTVVLIVRDEGPGVAPDLLPHLFGRFRSGGKKSSGNLAGHGQNAEGNGLGLAICQSILSVHRGSISYQAAPKGGAIFEIRLPQRASPIN